VVRIVYDEENIYIGVLCKSDDPDAISPTTPDGNRKWWAKREQTEPDLKGTWWGPSVEFFLAPGGDRMNYYQLVPDIMGNTWDKYTGKPAEAWNSGWTVKTVRKDKEWTLEAAIPLASMRVERIRKGDSWGLNICRTAPGRQMWTFVHGPGGFHTPEDFGLLTFE
jgi:hypothetical protein